MLSSTYQYCWIKIWFYLAISRYSTLNVNLFFHFSLSWMSWTAYLLTSVLWLSWLSYRANATTTTHWVEWQWNRGIEHWAVSSFARTAHSLPFSALLARSTALIHSLTRSFSPELMRKIYFYELNVSISCHFNPLCSTSAPAAPTHKGEAETNERVTP